MSIGTEFSDTFVPVAADSEFSVHNLPMGVFRKGGGPLRCGIAIGEEILDLTELESRSLLKLPSEVFQNQQLNGFISLGAKYWRSLRQQVRCLLSIENRLLQGEELRRCCFVKMSDVTMQLPVTIGDYTDFYSSLEHAKNVGAMFRDADNPLLPNWRHLPVGYHGRSSSVVVSKSPIRRPMGQTLNKESGKPEFTPSRVLDFELELGFIVGKDSELGQPIPVREAEDYIFGVVLVNDWSARDIQKWEYVPLGPFVSKSFATSISPWIVSLSALEPFRVRGQRQDPPPMYYLDEGPRSSGLDCSLEVELRPPGVEAGTVICCSNTKHLYWSMAQQLAHHTVTGCNVKVGDLMASGTISGPEPGSYGSMLELSWAGSQEISVGAQVRKFLQDGDTVTMRAHCQATGYRVGFGELSGHIVSALHAHPGSNP